MKLFFRKMATSSHAVLFALLVSACVLPSVEGQSTKANSRAVEATRDRQERIKTLVVELKRTELTAPGAITGAMPGPLKKGSNVVIPLKETTVESVSRLVLDAKKFRFEENHPSFHFPSGNLIRRDMIFTFDGALGRVLAPQRTGKDSPLAGIIEKGQNDFKIKLIHLMPLMLTFRGMSSIHSSYVVGDMRSTGAMLVIDGSKCEEYVIRFSPNRREQFWLDPEKDYVLRRHQRSWDQTDVSYRRDANWGWVPTSWKRTEYTSAKSVAATMTITLQNMRINDAQPESQFTLEFPAGSTVEDQRDNKSYRVQPDGSMREVSGSGDLLPGSIPQPGTSWYRQYKWSMVSIGLISTIILVYLARRMRSRES